MVDPLADDMAEQFWESIYRDRDSVGSGQANHWLVEIAASLTAGRALDVGCAEGADALWLAQCGWAVTAVDVSETALARARARAEQNELADRIDFQLHDLSRTRPIGEFDLVSAQYFQSPIEFDRNGVLRFLAGHVAPGGLLLIVDHASVAPWSWSAGRPARFPTATETLFSIGLMRGEWDIRRLEAVSRVAVGPAGQSASVVDNVIVIRRRDAK